jgi:hypothetical protein
MVSPFGANDFYMRFMVSPFGANDFYMQFMVSPFVANDFYMRFMVSPFGANLSKVIFLTIHINVRSNPAFPSLRGTKQSSLQ